MISATLQPLYKCKFALDFLWPCTVAFDLYKIDVLFWLSHKSCQKLQSGNIPDCLRQLSAKNIGGGNQKCCICENLKTPGVHRAVIPCPRQPKFRSKQAPEKNLEKGGDISKVLV